MNSATNMVGKSIKIGRRDFVVVEQGDDDKGRPIYILQGKRGAKYGTCRTVLHPEYMFLVHASGGRGFGIPAGYEKVWLTDKDGDLRSAMVSR